MVSSGSAWNLSSAMDKAITRIIESCSARAEAAIIDPTYSWQCGCLGPAIGTASERARSYNSDCSARIRRGAYEESRCYDLWTVLVRLDCQRFRKRSLSWRWKLEGSQIISKSYNTYALTDCANDGAYTHKTTGDLMDVFCGNHVPGDCEGDAPAAINHHLLAPTMQRRSETFRGHVL